MKEPRIIIMGNICQKTDSSLGGSNTMANLSASTSSTSLEAEPDIELIYSPSSGEGESLKVLLSFLQVPYKETFQSGSSIANTMVRWNKNTILGTINCLKFLGYVFEMNPVSEREKNNSDAICDKIYKIWQDNRDHFYHNNRRKIHKFFEEVLPELFREIEHSADVEDRNNAREQVTIVDILLLTFVYNLFLRKGSNKYYHVLDNAPKIKALCISLIENHRGLDSYFRTRKFNLYI